MGTSYLCMLGFPQAWPKKTGRAGVSPRLGTQLLRKFQISGISLSLQWERNEEGLSGQGLSEKGTSENRTPSFSLAFLGQTGIRLGREK